MAAILTATIRVKNQTRRGPAAKPRHAQSIRHSVGLHMRPHAPAHHLAAEQVQHRRQVQPALVGGDVGDVAALDLIGRLGREVALQQVRGNRQIVFTVRGDDKLSFAPGLDAVALHQLSHSFLSHANVSGQQFLPHLGPTVFLFDLGVDRLDVNQQGFIADALVRPWPAGHHVLQHYA